MWAIFKLSTLRSPLRKAYLLASYTFSAVALLFLVANLICYLYLRTLPHAKSPSASPVAAAAYGQLPNKKVEQLLSDFQKFEKLGTIFKPYTLIADPVFSSETINVDRNKQGFERRLGPEPKYEFSDSLYLLGGMNAFGPFLADEWTVGARLQNSLDELYTQEKIPKPIRVENFASRGHNWFQTLILFERLIYTGKKPKYVLFLDGLPSLERANSPALPYWTEKAVQVVEGNTHEVFKDRLPSIFPIFRVFNKLLRLQERKALTVLVEQRYPELTDKNESLKTNSLAKNYVDSVTQRRLVAENNGIVPLFFLEPTPGSPCIEASNPQEKTVYRKIERAKTSEVFPLSQLCRNLKKETPYINDAYFSPAMAKMVAATMADKISHVSTLRKNH